MTSPGLLLRRTFSALSVRNYRLFFFGQVVSVSGSWMQRVAQSWLVLELTGSGSAVGGVTALQFLPILTMAPIGGLVADRFDKRKLLFATQSLAATTAAILGFLVVTDAVELWMVYVLAFALGCVGAFDNPARQAMVMELVGRDRVTNAIGLTSMLMNTARIIGPAVGGVLIVAVGIGACFLINAFSYVAMLVALSVMRGDEMVEIARQPPGPGQLRAAFQYVRSESGLWVPMAMMGVVGLFVHEFEVSLPLLARFTFAGQADVFGAMFSALGVGAVAGGLYTAVRGERPGREMVWMCYVLGGAMIAVALAPMLAVALVCLVVVGAGLTGMMTVGNSLLQLRSVPEMRGRVLALRAMAILGLRPIGAPIVGFVGEHVGPRFSIALGAVAAIAVAAWAHRLVLRSNREPVPA